MKKFKKMKIYRKYEDFFTEEDLRDPDAPKPINLCIDDFDARGHIVNPRAPCVGTTIDPDYIKDAKEQLYVRKFRMKSDILILREITRRKFLHYATQQMYLDKQRESQHNEKVYRQITEFHETAEKFLKDMESDAFSDMSKAHQELERIQKVKLNDEWKALMSEHQRAVMQVRDVYERFLFLLKLIGYFDDVADEVGSDTKLPSLAEMELNISDQNPAGTSAQIQQIRNYVDSVVRPYLAKERHLDADIWLKGFEKTRYKISNYNQRLTNLALMNHIVKIISDKFHKTYNEKLIKPVFLKDPDFMKERVKNLRERAVTVLNNFVRENKTDKIMIKLNGIIPVILESIEGGKSMNGATNEQTTAKSTKEVAKTPAKDTADAPKEVPKKPTKDAVDARFKGEPETILAKVEKIQAHVLCLLNKFDSLPTDHIKAIEARVRRKKRLEKEMSKRALVKQNRLYNWMKHFTKHELENQAYTRANYRKYYLTRRKQAEAALNEVK